MSDEQITNTTEQRREHWELAREAGVPVSAIVPAGSIEASERAGQTELLLSSLLPYALDKDDAPFEALGFKFGEPVQGDDLFREATLPEGWKREGSDHAMWSYIIDEQGFRRVAIFYKAAFYDRGAHSEHRSRPGDKGAGRHLRGVRRVDSV